MSPALLDLLGREHVALHGRRQQGPAVDGEARPGTVNDLLALSKRKAS